MLKRFGICLVMLLATGCAKDPDESWCGRMELLTTSGVIWGHVPGLGSLLTT